MRTSTVQGLKTAYGGELLQRYSAIFKRKEIAKLKEVSVFKIGLQARRKMSLQKTFRNVQKSNNILSIDVT